MKAAARVKAARPVRRELFAELSEGMAALAEARQGKRTLRTHAIEHKPAPTVVTRAWVACLQPWRRRVAPR